ncbi:hypothetical protein [Nocardioides jishulii]|uniref:Uncharacterized protein n=1 Tax=Nocardioides jishulii TaxID=2575440 RepID=A0A4U2YIW3_9ACTN|nr:hypothetical protein [Nocardioides jishulii]QCX27951.1 hypothetical protein FCL41_10820 [Nocardioides jishulii]TKI60614.1 hypothetical protein FC770_13895 [Nocardioides jishulii]
MRWGRRDHAVHVPTLLPRERILAHAVAEDGSVIAGTRDALHVVPADGADPTRVPWELVEAAEWDAETSTFRVSEVGEWGAERPESAFVLGESRLLLELVRERVTASIVLQRHVAVPGGGMRVIARRSPHGGTDPLWVYEYDATVDPTDPRVREAAAAALAQAKDEVGLA